MSDDIVSAAGERAAMGGYVPQFNEFARFAYCELVNNNLKWIKIADPDAEKLDDIQYATRNEVHTYQVKWGNWARESDSVDVLFKAKYTQFNKKWFEKFGWYFYKKPVGTDQQHFHALHVPSENSVISFSDQLLILVKLTIDSLNEEMLTKDLQKVDNEKGIAKLKRFLDYHNSPFPNMINFLRNLQDLRSGMIAHRFSNSNKNVNKAMTFFGLTEEKYQEVAVDIFVKSIYTINTLSRVFLDKDEEED